MPTSFSLSQLVLISAGYLLIFFGVAWMTEKGWVPRRLVRHPLKAKELPRPFEYALSNSFGFGGANAALLFRKCAQ